MPRGMAGSLAQVVLGAAEQELWHPGKSSFGVTGALYLCLTIA